MDGYPNPPPALVQRVVQLARAVEADPAHVGVLSSGERCAVALLHGKTEYLPSGYTNMLDAINRLETTWVEACIKANNDGWRR
jgi:hypothetical protein